MRARLRHRRIRTPLRRVLRLMHEHGLLAPSRSGAARGSRAHDGAIVPATGTDLTAVWTGEGPAVVFVVIDHSTGECVGLHAAARATRFQANPSAMACAVASADSRTASPVARPRR